MPDTGRRRAYPMLGLLAYAIVPGERRRRAAGHFRRAGFEFLRGVGALARPETPAEQARRREEIEIE